MTKVIFAMHTTEHKEVDIPELESIHAKACRAEPRQSCEYKTLSFEQNMGDDDFHSVVIPTEVRPLCHCSSRKHGTRIRFDVGDAIMSRL